ncbi:helix-turn-helix transcriptional regulator [Pseudonocardia adelaidensis]|uniref:HTH luxR-type domain-containing protein n=1 Tax=Pseudonocardia adelaidensis TaxID=648754 RepID=A0ABP9NS25_9PSEU
MAGAPTVLPGPVSSFVGRRRELAAVAGLVARQRLVSLVGPGGCGKTRLAAEWARSQPAELVGFVELASLPDAALLPVAVLVACGIREEPGTDAVDRVASRLAGEPGVLVLDTCEHLRDEVAAFVDVLLRRCARLRILVTSRVSLGTAGETVLPVGGLSSDGPQLFLDRARAVQPDLAPDVGSARRICELADGLPLAIELAAAKTRALPLTHIEAGMADRLRFLARTSPVGEPRHRSMEACIGWSYRLAEPRSRRALRALSVLPGRFTVEAAAAVAGEPALEPLVDQSLVTFHADDGRYVLLDMVREFAAGELSAAGEAEAVALRLLGWADELARSAAPGLDRADPATVRRVERDDAGVRAALEYAVRSRKALDVAAAIVVGLTFYWSLRGRCGEGLLWARRVAAATASPPCGLTWAMAFLASYTGDVVEGSRLGAAAAAEAAAAGDDRVRGRALVVVGMDAIFSRPAHAQVVLTEAVDRTDRACDGWGSVEARQALAYAFLVRSDHRAALAHLDAAVPVLTELGHAQLRAWDAAGRAEAAVLAGRFSVAESEGRRGLALAGAVGEPVSAVYALRPLAKALCQQGRVADAAAELAAAASFFAAHPGLGVGEELAVCAATVAVWRDPATATPAAEEAVRAAGEVAGQASEAGALLAIARLAAGDPDGACAAAAAAVRCAEPIEARESACTAGLAWCAAERMLGTAGAGTVGRAHRVLAAAADLALLPQVADALDVVAGLALDQGRPAVAARLHAAAARTRAEMGSRPSALVDLFRPADDRAVAARLDAEQLAAAGREGARLTAARAAAYAARSRGRRARPRSGWESLTPTERDVVALVARGLGNQAIGAQLLITEGTVRTHLRSVFGKLGLRSRTELAAEFARRDR